MSASRVIFALRQDLLTELRKPIIQFITDTIDDLVVKNDIECKGFRYLGRAFYASNSVNEFVRYPVWKLDELKSELVPRLEKILETEEKIKNEESKLELTLGLILAKAENITEAVSALPRELIRLVPKYENYWEESLHLDDKIYNRNQDLFDYYIGMRML